MLLNSRKHRIEAEDIWADFKTDSAPNRAGRMRFVPHRFLPRLFVKFDPVPLVCNKRLDCYKFTFAINPSNYFSNEKFIDRICSTICGQVIYFRQLIITAELLINCSKTINNLRQDFFRRSLSYTSFFNVPFYYLDISFIFSKANTQYVVLSTCNPGDFVYIFIFDKSHYSVPQGFPDQRQSTAS